MTDSARTALPGGSRRRGPHHILERIEKYADENPEAVEYLLTGEEEAAEVLLAMAATMKLIQADLEPGVDKQTVKDICQGYRNAVVRGKATEVFRHMTDDDQLEIYGLRLRMRRVLLQ